MGETVSERIAIRLTRGENRSNELLRHFEGQLAAPLSERVPGKVDRRS